MSRGRTQITLAVEGEGGFVKCLRLFTRGVGGHGVVYVNIVYIIDIEYRDIENRKDITISS